MTSCPPLILSLLDSRFCLFCRSLKASNMSVYILPVAYTTQSHDQSSYSLDDLPKNVLMTLNQGSTVKSMDFHPAQQVLLLVGTNIGDIVIWDLSSRDRLAHRNFKVWDLTSCSMPLQVFSQVSFK